MLLATRERASAFNVDPGVELAKLSVPVGEDGMKESETDGVHFKEGRCFGGWVGSLMVHQLGEVDSATVARWEAVYRGLWASRGWFLTEETAPAADADSSNQDGDGGGLPSGDGAGPGPEMKEAERAHVSLPVRRLSDSFGCGFSNSFEFLSVHLHTRRGITDHRIFVSPANSSFIEVVTELSYMIERDINQSHIPELAKLLRGFDESAYRLELNGEVMSRSSWDVAGFDGFDLLGEAPSRSTLHVKVLQGDDGPISSPAAQPGATECSVTSPLYVKDGEKIYDLFCCLTQTTMSELFSEVLEKMAENEGVKLLEKFVENDAFERGSFLLRIGPTNFGLNERSKTTTLDEAGCIKESTIHVIFLPPLKPEEAVADGHKASAISSPAAQPEPDIRMSQHSS